MCWLRSEGVGILQSLELGTDSAQPSPPLYTHSLATVLKSTDPLLLLPLQTEAAAGVRARLPPGYQALPKVTPSHYRACPGARPPIAHPRSCPHHRPLGRKVPPHLRPFWGRASCRGNNSSVMAHPQRPGPTSRARSCVCLPLTPSVHFWTCSSGPLGWKSTLASGLPLCPSSRGQAPPVTVT